MSKKPTVRDDAHSTIRQRLIHKGPVSWIQAMENMDWIQCWARSHFDRVLWSDGSLYVFMFLAEDKSAFSNSSTLVISLFTSLSTPLSQLLLFLYIDCSHILVCFFCSPPHLHLCHHLNTANKAKTHSPGEFQAGQAHRHVKIISFSMRIVLRFPPSLRGCGVMNSQ